jgi:hypothetical protein
MSFHRQLLLLIGIALMGTCAIRYRLNSTRHNETEYLDVLSFSCAFNGLQRDADSTREKALDKTGFEIKPVGASKVRAENLDSRPDPSLASLLIHTQIDSSLKQASRNTSHRQSAQTRSHWFKGDDWTSDPFPSAQQALRDALKASHWGIHWQPSRGNKDFRSSTISQQTGPRQNTIAILSNESSSKADTEFVVRADRQREPDTEFDSSAENKGFLPAVRTAQLIKNDHIKSAPMVSPGTGRSVTEFNETKLPTASESQAASTPGQRDFQSVASPVAHAEPAAPSPAVSRDAPTGPTAQPAVVPGVLHPAHHVVFAAQPEFGAHWKNETPVTDQRAVAIEAPLQDFSPGPRYDCQIYDPYQQQHVYEGKTLNATQRPLLEVGRPWYQLGQLSPPSPLTGRHNPLEQQFLVFGDFRSGIASNSVGGDSSTLTANQLNLNFDWKLTSTERFHMFASPLTRGLNSTGYLFDEERLLDNTNANILFGYFEGDLGAITGGMLNQTYPFDLPFAVGVVPLIFQNGVWMEDQILGFAFTIPSRNSPRLDISNMDITFFAGYDKLVSDAFPGEDGAAKIYGIASFLEAWNGFVEADYAFLEDRTFLDRSYHNLGLGYTRRYGRLISNSTRIIFNLGQRADGINQTADGVLLLSENSLITGAPSTVVPYFNLFAGFDRPQSAARNALAGGVLRNTGILFESDNLTNYPTLDPTANETFGAAFGLNLLASDFSQQLVVETAFLNTIGSDIGRNAAGNQYGLGARYQLPLTNSMIFRTDAMYGFLDHTPDIHGVRVELRHKF